MDEWYVQMAWQSLFDGELSIDGEEPALEGSGLGVVSDGLRKVVEVLSDAVEEGQFLVLLGIDPFDVVRILGHDEVGKGQVAQHEGLLSDRIVEFCQFGEVLLNDAHLGSLVVLVEEESADGTGGLTEDGDESLDFSLILGVLSEQLLLAVAVDDVPLNGSGFGDVELAVNQVGQVGEGEAKVRLVLAEPLRSLSVLFVLELHSRVRQEKSGHMSQTSDSPIAELNLSVFDVLTRDEGFKNGIRSVVVGPDSGELFEVVSDSPEELVLLLEVRGKGLDDIEPLGKDEVGQSQVADGELAFSDELLEVVELGLHLLEGCSLGLGGGVGTHGGPQLLEDITDHSEDVVDGCLILSSLAEQLIVTTAADDVLEDGGGLSELEVTVNEVGEVRELKAQILLIFLEPLLPGLVLDFSEGGVGVGEQKTGRLGQSAQFPITQGHACHQRFVIRVGIISRFIETQSEKLKLNGHQFLMDSLQNKQHG